MTFFYYNLSPVIPQLREVHSILPAIALSKEPVTISTQSANAQDLVDSDFLERYPIKLSDMLYSVLSLSLEESQARANADIIKTIHKLKHKKMKDKRDMQFVAMGAKIMREGLELVRQHVHNMIIVHEMHRINPFLRDNLLRPIYLNHSSDNYEGAEDERALQTYMAMVADTEFHYMTVCTEQMTEGFSTTGLEENNLPHGFFENGILKIKMLELPGFLAFKRNKYALLRESLLPELETWWKAMQDLYTDFGFTDFNAGNLEAVKDKARSMLVPAAEQLNKKVKESVYMQQLANDEYGEFGSTMYFAITGRMNLLKAYRRSEQMTDAVLEKLNSLYTKENKQDKIVCFLLHEMTDYPPMKRYESTDGPLLVQMWEDSMKG